MDRCIKEIKPIYRAASGTILLNYTSYMAARQGGNNENHVLTIVPNDQR